MNACPVLTNDVMFETGYYTAVPSMFMWWKVNEYTCSSTVFVCSFKALEFVHFMRHYFIISGVNVVHFTPLHLSDSSGYFSD